MEYNDFDHIKILSIIYTMSSLMFSKKYFDKPGWSHPLWALFCVHNYLTTMISYYFLFKVLTGARYNDDGILSPIELVTVLTKVGFHFKPNLQADVHELFIHLFSVIEDEAYKTSCSVSLRF